MLSRAVTSTPKQLQQEVASSATKLQRNITFEQQVDKYMSAIFEAELPERRLVELRRELKYLAETEWMYTRNKNVY